MLHAVLRRAVFAVAVVPVLFSPEAVRARDLPVEGGPGGGAFRLDCSPSQLLSGFDFRAGAFVDAIAPRCSTLIIAQRIFGPPTALMMKGGKGGGRTSRECDRSDYIAGIKFGFTRDGDAPKYVDFVELICRDIATGVETRVCLDTGDRCPDSHPARPSLRAAVQRCADNEAAAGIVGRYGIYVDALGLICVPKPAAMLPQTSGGGGQTQPNPNFVVPPQWRDMLAAHNDRRKQHCVPPLQWSRHLAIHAQSWADKCTNTHSGQGNGENLATFAQWSFDPRDPKKEVDTLRMTNRQVFEQAWYCEVKQYNFDRPALAGGFTQNCAPPTNGHFTQVVWKSTRFVGCGVKVCQINGHATHYWVCQYSPGGNDPARLAENVLRPTCH